MMMKKEKKKKKRTRRIKVKKGKRRRRRVGGHILEHTAAFLYPSMVPLQVSSGTFYLVGWLVS